MVESCRGTGRGRCRSPVVRTARVRKSALFCQIAANASSICDLVTDRAAWTNHLHALGLSSFSLEST